MTSFKLILTGYFLLLVTGLYEGRLLTHLMIAKAEQPIGSITELASKIKDGSLTLMLQSRQSPLFDLIDDSTVGEHRYARSVRSM